MRILSWLRRLVAGFFCVDADERHRQARKVEERLEELRAVALLMVAQARRTELELREMMGEDEPDTPRIAAVVTRLEDERARADELLERYREAEEEAEQRLGRLGQARALEEINERREDLRTFVNRAGEAGDEEQLDEARAEAMRLDVLEHLDAGKPPPSRARWRRGDDEEVMARARRLLEQDRPGPGERGARDRGTENETGGG